MELLLSTSDSPGPAPGQSLHHHCHLWVQLLRVSFHNCKAGCWRGPGETGGVMGLWGDRHNSSMFTTSIHSCQEWRTAVSASMG